MIDGDSTPTPRLPAGVEAALELLLPDADDARRAEAERVADFLRLLQADAGRAGEGVSVDLARARDDLARSGRDRLESALHDLCAHHLAALIGTARFLDAGEPTRSAAEAWRDLESLREEYDGLAELPTPGEPLSAVAARLIESLARHTGDAAAGLWHARLIAALRGPRDGETAFRARIQAVGDEVVPAAVWAGTIECALDRGSVHSATDLATECFALCPTDARLGRLLVWCKLLSGDLAAARALDAHLGAWKGNLPGSLLRLRTELPECLSILSGRSPRNTAATPAGDRADADALLDRTAIGAQLIAVVQLHPSTGAELVAYDAAPTLRSRIERWFEDREGAAQRSGTPEHRVLRDASAQAWHRVESASLADSLGGADSRAALLQPILDEAGETCGWLRIECSHHLLPTPECAEALAHAWRIELLRRRGRWERSDEQPTWVEPTARSGDIARVFERLVASLHLKWARRAWWGFEVLNGVPRLVAHGGEGLGPLDEAPGRGRALHRSLSCGGPVRGEEPDVGLYLHAQSAAGVALCLRVGELCVGALVIESERRRDFSAEETERLSITLNDGALRLRLEQFRAHHAAHHGSPVFADPDSPGFRAFHERLRSAQTGSAPLVLVGPSGAGKRVLSRWAQFESQPEAPARAELTIEAWLANGARTDAYLTGLDDLDARGQFGLLRALEDGAHTARLAFGTRVAPSTAAREGRLMPELAARLGCEQWCVPGFADRRDEIGLLAKSRLRELARSLSRPLPRLDDASVAFLWRQTWLGNWRELDARLHHLLRRTTADPVTVEELVLIWRAAGQEPVLRLASRKPPVEWLRNALVSTATAGGRANKRRAALYLGWDPDTLAARLAEAGLKDVDPDARGAGWLGTSPKRPAD